MTNPAATPHLQPSSLQSGGASAGGSQNDLILEWIKAHGSITPAQAYEQFGVLAMHSRAAELRRRGYNIVCRIQTNGRKRWGRYFICA